MNQKINSWVVEDEPAAARNLQRMLADMNIDTQLILQSKKELRIALEEEIHPDLLFLDIHLQDGLVFELLNDIYTELPIIFTTAYDQHALRAFKEHSIDYLLKPIDPSELSAAVEKYKNWHSNTNKTWSQIQQELSSLTRKHWDRIAVEVGSKLKSIPINEVVIIYSDNKMTYLLHNSGRKFIISYSLEACENHLNTRKWFRINRSTIVNHSFIGEVHKMSSTRLKIHLNRSFKPKKPYVSRQRCKNFKNWYGI